MADRLSLRCRVSSDASIAVFLPTVDEQLRLCRALDRLSISPQAYIPGIGGGAFEDFDGGAADLLLLLYEAAGTGQMIDHVIVAGFDEGTDWWSVDPRGTNMLTYRLCASARDRLELSAIGGSPLAVLDHLPLDLFDDCR